MIQKQISNKFEINTLADLPRFQAGQNPKKVAFNFKDRLTTYAQFDDYANLVAQGLLADGIAKGVRVGFLDKNSDNYYQVVFGSAKANAVVLGINWRLAPPEVLYILNDSRAEVLFVGPDFFDLVERIKDDMKHVRHIIALSGRHPDWEDFCAWRDRQNPYDPMIDVSSHDVAVQMYTSGTTGLPKGVQLQHKSFFELRRMPPNNDMEWDEWNDRDVSLVAMPSFHIAGVGWGVMGLLHGVTNVVVDQFDPGETLELIESQGISKIFLVPTAIQMILQHPDSHTTDYTNIKHIRYGTSPISLDLLREAINVFQCGFVQFYGMTETCGSVTYLPPQDHDVEGNERMRSAGKPLPGVEVKIVDAQNRSLPARTIGEICIKSPSSMLGYWGLQDDTVKTLIDGFVHTGDAGYLDEDGYVYVQDRIKDMIVSGGENVYPAEVENALAGHTAVADVAVIGAGHTAVADVAVIGVPDDRWGESVKAVVVLKPGHQVPPDDIIKFARNRIAGYKCPKSVDFVAELPRNPSGKILKKDLRKPYWKGMARQVH